MWHNIDGYHKKWYKENILIAGKQNLSQHLFKANKNQHQPLENDLNARFSEKKFLSSLYLISNVMLHCKEKLGEIEWKATLKRCCEFYQDDFPKYQMLDSETDFRESYQKCYNCDIVEEIKAIIRQSLFLVFKTSKQLSLKRLFSVICRLKNYTRSNMTIDRLNSLVLMHIHRDIIRSIDDALDTQVIGS